MKKFIKSLIISSMAFGIIAPLGMNASVSAKRVRRYHAPAVRITRRRGQYRRYGRKIRQRSAKRTKRSRRYRKHTERGNRARNKANAISQVIARVHNADKSAIMADRSSLEQVKSEAKYIAREAKHDHLTKSARRSYLREAHDLYTQANALEAECN